jgi:hypothetical protein
LKKIKKECNNDSDLKTITEIESYNLFVDLYRNMIFTTREGVIYIKNVYGIWNAMKSNDIRL